MTVLSVLYSFTADRYYFSSDVNGLLKRYQQNSQNFVYFDLLLCFHFHQVQISHSDRARISVQIGIIGEGAKIEVLWSVGMIC